MLYLSRTQWGAQPPKGGAFTRLNRRRVTGVVIHHSGVDEGGTHAVEQPKDGTQNLSPSVTRGTGTGNLMAVFLSRSRR